MPRILALLALVTVVCATEVQAQNVSRQIDVDDTFTGFDLKWTGAASGRYVARWTVRRVGGVLEMCGIGLATGSGIGTAIRAKQKSAVLSLNGKPALKDIRFFSQARSAAELKSGKANCRSSRVKAVGDSAEISLTFAE